MASQKHNVLYLEQGVSGRSKHLHGHERALSPITDYLDLYPTGNETAHHTEFCNPRT